MDDSDSFGARLARLADDRGADVTDLARAGGIKEGAVYKILRGDQKTTSFQTGLRLAKFLEVNPWDLAFGSLESEPENRIDRMEAGIESLRTRFERLEQVLYRVMEMGAGYGAPPASHEAPIEKSRASEGRQRQKAG